MRIFIYIYIHTWFRCKSLVDLGFTALGLRVLGFISRRRYIGHKKISRNSYTYTHRMYGSGLMDPLKGIRRDGTGI